MRTPRIPGGVDRRTFVGLCSAAGIGARGLPGALWITVRGTRSPASAQAQQPGRGLAGLRIGYLKAAFEADHATKAFDEVTRSNRDDQMVQPMAGVDRFVTPSFGGNVVQITNVTGHLIAVGEAYQGATDFHRKHPPKFS